VVTFKIEFELFTLSAWFYGGADFARLPLRSRSDTSRFRSAHAPLTCSA